MLAEWSESKVCSAAHENAAKGSEEALALQSGKIGIHRSMIM
jgi:hypothetical protein